MYACHNGVSYLGYPTAYGVYTYGQYPSTGYGNLYPPTAYGYNSYYQG